MRSFLFKSKLNIKEQLGAYSSLFSPPETMAALIADLESAGLVNNIDFVHNKDGYLEVKNEKIGYITAEILAKHGAKIKGIVYESTGGDGEWEMLDDKNWAHLEAGNKYRMKHRSMEDLGTFVGWFKAGTDTTLPVEETDPERVWLRFNDDKYNELYDLYYYAPRKAFCIGSSADPVWVLET